MHPIDRLAAIRHEIQQLEAEANDIRRLIISGEVDPHGEFYHAKIRRQVVLLHESHYLDD